MKGIVLLFEVQGVFRELFHFHEEDFILGIVSLSGDDYILKRGHFMLRIWFSLGKLCFLKVFILGGGFYF